MAFASRQMLTGPTVTLTRSLSARSHGRRDLAEAGRDRTREASPAHVTMRRTAMLAAAGRRAPRPRVGVVGSRRQRGAADTAPAGGRVRWRSGSAPAMTEPGLAPEAVPLRPAGPTAAVARADQPGLPGASCYPGFALHVLSSANESATHTVSDFVSLPRMRERLTLTIRDQQRIDEPSCIGATVEVGGAPPEARPPPPSSGACTHTQGLYIRASAANVVPPCTGDHGMVDSSRHAGWVSRPPTRRDAGGSSAAPPICDVSVPRLSAPRYDRRRPAEAEGR